MLKPFDDRGRELDALYTINPSSDGFDLIVESRGGSDHGPNAARNSAYAPALEQHLLRMGAFGMELHQLQVASSVAMKLSLSDRTVRLDNFSLPLTLSSKTDVIELRLSIGRASAAFGRTDGSDRGNRTKRMQLCVRWPGAVGMSGDDLERMFAWPISAVAVEKPTDDPHELQKRVEKATRLIRSAARHTNVLPPPGQSAPVKATSTSSVFVRDPNVIAWVLNTAAGCCEICGNAAPFIRTDGEPFLEVHHVRPLGEGGPDTTDNAAACCPNCHRRLHHDLDRDMLRRKAIGSIGRLKDYPRIVTQPATAFARIETEE